MKTLIALPSYNERDNIADLIRSVISLSDDYHVLVVDDSSPDETGSVVEKFIDSLSETNYGRVELIVRDNKRGRGSAVWEGFNWGLRSKENFQVFIEMDCDFSHDPSALSQGIEILGKGANVVLGARYPNGQIINWPMKRRIFSYCANLLARLLIKWSIQDYTNGYRFYSRPAVEVLSAQKMHYAGYINLSETIALSLERHLVIQSFPITFKNRKAGRSNTNFGEVLTSLFAIFSIAWRYRRGQMS